MLLVDARAGISAIHGIGLIAHEFIPKGTLMWVLQPGFDLFLTEAELEALAPPTRRQARRYVYYDARHGCYILSSDDSRFCNHSDDPNMADDGENIYAARDIHPGEEITWDYRPSGSYPFIEE